MTASPASPTRPAADHVWSSDDTTIEQISDALTHLLSASANQQRRAPARMLNLVVVVDRAGRDRLVQRLDRVGRYHASRAIIVVVEPGRQTLGAWASMSCDMPETPGGVARSRERIELSMGEDDASHLSTIVSSLLVTDVQTLAWTVDHAALVADEFDEFADVVLVDSGAGAVLADGFDAALRHGDALHVVDLAWMRSQHWRERIASTFVAPQHRALLDDIATVEVRIGKRSRAAGLLLAGWLGSRLGWSFGNGQLLGGAGPIDLQLQRDESVDEPRLEQVRLTSCAGAYACLRRIGAGFEIERGTDATHASSCLVLAARRDEGSILGESIREALLRDATYPPALELARALAGGDNA